MPCTPWWPLFPCLALPLVLFPLPASVVKHSEFSPSGQCTKYSKSQFPRHIVPQCPPIFAFPCTHEMHPCSHRHILTRAMSTHSLTKTHIEYQKELSRFTWLRSQKPRTPLKNSFIRIYIIVGYSYVHIYIYIYICVSCYICKYIMLYTYHIIYIYIHTDINVYI